MDEDSINTLTLISQTNINEGAESMIIDFSGRKNVLNQKKKDLDHLITQFNFRKEQLFHHVEKFSQTKKDFIKKSNQYYEDHQTAIINIKDEIKLQKNELENKEKNIEQVQEKLRFTSLSIETQNLYIRKLERQEKESEEQMIFYQKIIKDGDNTESQAQKKESRISHIHKLINCCETSIARYENLILHYELQISELKIKINDCYEKQTDIFEQRNAILTKANFNFIAIKEKINQLKSIQSSKCNKDPKYNQLIEINKNKTNLQQKLFDVQRQLTSKNDRLIEIKDEIQNKIKQIETLQELIEKPNKAIQNLRSRRMKRENLFNSKHDRYIQSKLKIESKKKFYLKKISDFKESELKLDSELKTIEKDIVCEDAREKEISLQNEVLAAESDRMRTNEIFLTKKSVKLLDRVLRRVEVMRNQKHDCHFESSRSFGNCLGGAKCCSKADGSLGNTGSNTAKSIGKTDSKSNSNTAKSIGKAGSKSNSNTAKSIDKTDSKSNSNTAKSIGKTGSKSNSNTAKSICNSYGNKLEKNSLGSNDSKICPNSMQLTSDSNNKADFKGDHKGASVYTHPIISTPRPSCPHDESAKAETDVACSHSTKAAPDDDDSNEDARAVLDLGPRIHQAAEASSQLRAECSKEKQNFLKQQIQSQLFQINRPNSEDDQRYKEIGKQIAEARLLYLQRMMEMSSKNQEIEIRIQKKLYEIELKKNKLLNLKNEENIESNLIIAYSPLKRKSSDYSNDSVSRYERISWLYSMIKKEKEDWLKYYNNITINSRLQVWNNFLDRI